jgi:hypothetical protein
MEACQRNRDRMQTNDRINLPPLKRAFWFAIQLYCFLFCLALGASELSRTYQYKGFDTNGNLLVEGTITLRVDETIQVKGEWKLQVRDRSKLKELGPQDGSGKITGQLKGDSIFLNLSPEEFENNIFLDGRVTKSDIFKITGKWGYYGYVGKLNEGNFEMVRKEAPK